MKVQIKKLIPLLIILTAIIATGATADDSRSADNYGYENHSLLLVPQLPDDMIDDFQAGYFDVAQALPDGGMKVVATSRDKDILITRFNARIEIENMEEYYRARLDPTKAMGGYHTYDETLAELEALHTAHPSITRLDTIGYTYEGRVMFAFKISDNAAVEEADEPEVQFNGLLHAREPMGLEICLATANYLLDNQAIPEVAEMINTTQIWFVPIINPDGYVYNETTNPLGGGMWRKNRKDNGDGTFGIDLNRNWGFKWAAYPNSSPDPSTLIYHGTGPFSEPEVQVLRDFINAHKFVSIVNFHSFGEVFLGPYGVANILGCPDDPIYETYVSLYANLTSYGYGYIGGLFGFGGDASCWQYAEQAVKPKSFAYLVETATDFWPTIEEMENHRQRNMETNLELIKDVSEMFYHPTFWIGTDPAVIDTVIDDCSESFSKAITLYNHHETTPISVSTNYSNMSGVSGWCTPTSLYNGIINPGENVSLTLDFDPSTMFGMPDESLARGQISFVLIAQDTLGTIDITSYSILMSYRADYNDGDSFLACEDNCPLIANEDQADFDEDGVGDVCDNCPNTFNDDQVDDDFDGFGDACDICPGFDDLVDNDEDGVPDGCDNCPEIANSSQDDGDTDGVGDDCDICPGYDDLVDSDEDSVPDGCDLCPGFDDLADLDEDGVPDDCDNCPETPNADQIDSDDNGIGDACQVICGDVNDDDEPNVGDAVFLINHVFKGGPAPDPICAGDANSDGDTNVGDAVFLINFVFKGGPGPDTNCCATQ